MLAVFAEAIDFYNHDVIHFHKHDSSALAVLVKVVRSPSDLFVLTGVFCPGILSHVRNVRYADPSLEALEREDSPKYSEAIIRAFRLRIATIRDAPDERDFYALRSLHFEKLQGNRSHQHSMRLNKQFRLILEFEGSGPDKTVLIVAIEDYH